MKKILLVMSTLAVMSSAVAEITSEIGVVSDYRFNGVSQTERNPALQGSVGYAHDSGWYVDLWGSNAHFAGGPVKVELDATLGYSLDIGDALNLDVGVATYNYMGKSGSGDINYPELFVGVTLPSDTSLYAHYTNDYSGEGISSYYFELGQEFELGDYTLSLIATHTKTSEDGYWGKESYYQHLEVAISRQWQGIDLSLAAIGTTIDKDEFGDKNGEPTVVLGISKAWDW